MATIRKRGAKWEVQVRRQGQPALSKSFIEHADAKRWARQMEAKADRANLPDLRVLQGVTLRELVERYRDNITPRHRGADTEKIVLDAFLRDNKELCAKSLSTLTVKDFATYRDGRLKSVQPATVRRQLVPIKHMFKVARHDWGYPIDNPLEGLSLEHSDNRRERRLKKGECDRLLAVAGDYMRDGTVARIIAFALETGMRRGEILAMRFRDIDWSEPSLIIPAAKNGHARTIPLSPRALALITPSTNPHVFPITPNSLRLAWDRLCDRAGIEGLNFHDLRHEAISRFFEQGLTVPEVALISGHRDLRMLSRYTHPQRKAILAKLANGF